MSDGPVLAIVPARGGSKGVPDKNRRELAGRPLLAYALDAARASGVVDRAVLSTDSEAIADLGRSLGLDVPFLRPPALARDDTPMQPVLEHCLDALEAEDFAPAIVVLLQPTSPLRTGAHIAQAVARLREGPDAVVTVVALPRHCSPDYVMRIDVAGQLVNFLPDGARITRRQDARVAYVRDGTVYAFWTRTLREQGSIYGAACAPLVLPAEESLSIDTPADWAEAERRLAARQSRG